MENAPELKAATATVAPTPTAAPQTCSSNASSGGFNRRTLYIGLAVAAAAGMFLGWDWFVAVGVSTFIIALLPCAIMCAVGVCAMRRGQSNKTESRKSSAPASPDVPVAKTAAESEASAPAPANRT